MASNLEIKARARDLRRQGAAAQRLATGGPLELTQHDTFFACANGRLKLREFADGTGELIRYERADTSGAKESRYERLPVADPAGHRRLLARALGVPMEVRKQRTVWFAGRTRIHLDRVAGLGDFIELEVVLGEGEPPGEAAAEARALMAALGIDAADLVAGAYADLLAARATAPPAR